ncbi:MAG: hypothetical protein ACFFAT_00930 [Promethearchaeota archaeon]
MIEIGRYDPREDKEALKELFDDFNNNISYFPVPKEQFERELNLRVLDLQYRNSMITAKENGKLVGFGTFTVFIDYLGNKHALIHQVMTRKEDSFKKGIENLILEELQKYVGRALKTDKFYYRCPDKDSNMRSLLLKLNQKKSNFFWYEN